MKKLKLEELNRLSPDEYRSSEKHPIVIILDNVRSMNNVGSAFRTADAFRIERVCLCGITARPPHREIHKTALGATETVEWMYFRKTVEAVEYCRDLGYVVVAVEQTDQSVSLEEFRTSPEKKYALVFGNEVFGVEDEVLSRSDACVEIPQFGTKHSLNISVSVGIVVWEFLRKIRLEI